jgi:hypothetical protein
MVPKSAEPLAITFRMWLRDLALYEGAIFLFYSIFRKFYLIGIFLA